MRTILHLSDLHFGRVDPRLVEPLLHTAHALAPDVTAVSGDLTQRARAVQFREARAFLERLPGARIVVPGNHDVPLDRPLTRLLRPLHAYRRWIDRDVEPVWADDELVVVGLSSAHGLTRQGGRLGREAMARACRRAGAAAPDAVRVAVVHHPPVLPAGTKASRGLASAERRLAALADCGIDVVLSGHLHTGYTIAFAHGEAERARTVLLVQAGTSLSTRRRGESNGFNLLRVAPGAIEIARFAWSDAGGRFEETGRERFPRASSGPVVDAPSRARENALPEAR